MIFIKFFKIPWYFQVFQVYSFFQVFQVEWEPCTILNRYIWEPKPLSIETNRKHIDRAVNGNSFACNIYHIQGLFSITKVQRMRSTVDTCIGIIFFLDHNCGMIKIYDHWSCLPIIIHYQEMEHIFINFVWIAQTLFTTTGITKKNCSDRRWNGIWNCTHNKFINIPNHRPYIHYITSPDFLYFISLQKTVFNIAH